jgi:regulator of protease activity HflC (stomatin/prohibitin superfamily)
MTELGKFIVALLQKLWPFRRVQPWERGVYIVFGSVPGTVGPGYYWPVIPWFIEVEPVSMVPAPVGTALMTVTLADGSAASFSVIAELQVTDERKALLNVDDYEESAVELVAAICAEQVARSTEEDLAADRRHEVMAPLADKINSRLGRFGVRCNDLWFTNLVIKVRTFRLLIDNALTSTSW